jgi:hypothetical protein
VHTDRVNSFILFYVQLILKLSPQLFVDFLYKFDCFGIFHCLSIVGQITHKIFEQKLYDLFLRFSDVWIYYHSYHRKVPLEIIYARWVSWPKQVFVLPFSSVSTQSFSVSSLFSKHAKTNLRRRGLLMMFEFAYIWK